MKKQLKLVATLLIVVMAAACSTEELKENANTIPCETNTVSIKTLETEYGCSNTKNNMHINLKDTFAIISNQAMFSQLVTGSCNPAIDFTTYDLLIGKKGLLTDNQSISYTAAYNCSNNKLELTVIFKQSVATNAPNFTYHVLIPKALNITPQKLLLNYQIQ